MSTDLRTREWHLIVHIYRHSTRYMYSTIREIGSHDPISADSVKVTSTILRTQVSSKRIDCDTNPPVASLTYPQNQYMQTAKLLQLSTILLRCEQSPICDSLRDQRSLIHSRILQPANQPSNEAPKYQQCFKHDRKLFQQCLPMHIYGRPIYHFSQASISLQDRGR